MRITALRCIGATEDPAILDKALEVISDSKTIKDQDVYVPLGGIRTTRAGCEKSCEHFLSNWDKYYERFPPGLSMLRSLVKFFCDGMGTREQLSKFKAFFADKDQQGYDNSVRQVIDIVQAKISWVERDSENVSAWLKTNGYLA